MGLKAFLIESGVDEFPAITPAHILAAMKEVKDEKTMLMFHAEMQPREKEEFSDSADTLTAEIDDFDLGMSASFIDRAPTPVVRLLSNDPGTTITNMRIVGYHTTMLGLSTRRSCQINKPRRWHTRRSWQGRAYFW